MGECTIPLRLIEAVNYLLLLLLSKWTVFIIEKKYVFKGPWWTVCSWYYVFVLYCIVLHFNVSFVNAVHFVYLVWCIRVLNSFSLPDNSYWKCLTTSLCVYLHQDMCKVKSHSSGMICGSRETYVKAKCNLLWIIRHE